MFNHLHSIMKKCLLSLCFLLAAISLHAQNDLSDKGYFGLKLGGSASVYQLHTYSVSAIPYYKINPKLDAGLGFNFMYSNHLGEAQGGRCSLPLYADVKYVFLKKSVALFAEAQFGLNVGLTMYKDSYYANYAGHFGTFQLGVSVRRSDISLGVMAYDYSKHGESAATGIGVEYSLFLRYAYNFRLTD